MEKRFCMDILIVPLIVSGTDLGMAGRRKVKTAGTGLTAGRPWMLRQHLDTIKTDARKVLQDV